MDIDGELTNAIGAFKMQLDARDALLPRRSRDLSGVIRAETSFASQLPAPESQRQPELAIPTMQKPCGMEQVSFTFHGVEGTDYGAGSRNILYIAKADFEAAIAQFGNDPSFNPLSPRFPENSVTLSCPGAPDSAITLDRVSSSGGRSGCFGAYQMAGYSYSDSSTDGALCTYSWGASGGVEESVDFGYVVSSAADYASSAGFWIQYILDASAVWHCSTNCQPVTCEPGTDCSPGVPCPDNQVCVSGSYTETSGTICCNLLGIGEGTTEPAGSNGTSRDVQVTGDGWAANGDKIDHGGGLVLWMQDPTPDCIGYFNI